MAARGNRGGRPRRVVPPTDPPVERGVPLPLPPLPPVPSVPMFGATVRFRINSEGRDEHRPAVVIREDAPGVCTLFVFTLPGDSIAAGARCAQQRAVARTMGDGVGQWQPINP